MDDRTLLEAAAKAAGYKIEGEADKLVCQPGHYAGGFSIYNKHGGSSLWNPLTDDGDALRLAVKLRLTLLLEIPRIGIGPALPGVEMYLDDDEDPYSATRLAIVLAAAEIGKAMK